MTSKYALVVFSVAVLTGCGGDSFSSFSSPASDGEAAVAVDGGDLRDTGGASAGGETADSGAGGGPASGGASSGGASAASGGAETGGKVGAETGGARSTGGEPGTGGRTSTGGTSSSGGTTSTGGTIGSGGSPGGVCCKLLGPNGPTGVVLPCGSGAWDYILNTPSGNVAIACTVGASSVLCEQGVTFGSVEACP